MNDMQSQGNRLKEVADLRSLFAQAPVPDEVTPITSREAWDAASSYRPEPEGAEFRQIDVGGIAATSVSSGANSSGRILYLHGGSYTAGSLMTHRHVLADLARFTKFEVIAPWYRLAPEHPFPAALDDAIAAYNATAAAGSGPLILAGDSAGAGLGAALLISLRSRAEIEMPAAFVCFSPWFDLTLVSKSIEENRDTDFTIDGRGVEMSAEAYAGDHDRKTPAISPLFGDWTGFPATLIQASGAELLLDDAIAGARAAVRGSAQVTLELWPDMPHGFHLLADSLSDGKVALQNAANWIRAQLEAPSQA